MSKIPDEDSRFPETNWGWVREVREGDAPRKRRALDELCKVYWRPVYAFARSNGYSEEDAKDITQGFFEMLLERDDFARTDPKKGKLRSFLLGAMKHFMSRARRDADRQKRGGGKIVLSLDLAEAEYRYLASEAAREASPDIVFDRLWVSALLDDVKEQLRVKYESEGKSEVFATFEAHLSPGANQPSLPQAAKLLGKSEVAARVIVHRLRRRYARMFRRAVAETLEEGDDVDAEIRCLMDIFAR